eukprot:4450745-Amphidinium_carterae.1
MQQSRQEQPVRPSKVRRSVVFGLAFHLCLMDALAMHQPHLAEGASYFPTDEYTATLQALHAEPDQPVALANLDRLLRQARRTADLLQHGAIPEQPGALEQLSQ